MKFKMRFADNPERSGQYIVTAAAFSLYQILTVLSSNRFPVRHRRRFLRDRTLLTIYNGKSREP